ncbi:Gfo/Idh/MocA family protein [Saccharibacillus sp. JS10]|uniref:Gfo/Idh/MocA family protein n=1 Tax=Saccharibacillus sp. JS10 TaxID=2950552 RepID=UPI00210C97F8|nr:Gfo/Idh/MocA family oxidoreductase [Saccharibacillus sp. JS10]MCQ4087862.1 Gfo/Idh/MocA family oxidoreductase [Saccharibacillus sp. JS10]
MKQIKLAVIGLGNMGRNMIHRLVPRYADQVELVALCDSSEDQLQRESEKVAGSPKLYTDYRVLLAETDADIVYIAVPPSMHCDAFKLASERGLHVFCEKPLANSLEEAKEMMELSKQSDRLNVIHFSFPLEPTVLKFRELIAQGAAGEIEQAHLYLEFPRWPRDWQQNDWIGTRREGGYLLEVGIHWINLIQQTFGAIVEVRSDVQFPADKSLCETITTATLRLESGLEIQLSGTDQREGEERVSLVVQGSGGTVALENWGNLFVGAWGEAPQLVEVESDDEDDKIHLPIFGRILQILNGEQATVYDFKDGYHAQLVLEALRNPSEDGGFIDLRPQLSM